MGTTLIGAVLSSVHHAKVIAYKTAGTFGTLILAMSVLLLKSP